MKEISVSDFKATCLEVIRTVTASGETILITKRGVPVAQLAPPPTSKTGSDWLGQMKGTGEILGDIVGPLDLEWEALS